MKIKLGQIKLFSADTKALATFLAFVFDEAPNAFDDGTIELNIFNMTFLICESSDENVLQNTKVCFESDDSSAFEVFNQKIQFYQYKSDTNIKAAQMTENALCFFDTDGREWEFYLSKSLAKPISAESSANLTSLSQM